MSQKIIVIQFSPKTISTYFCIFLIDYTRGFQHQVLPEGLAIGRICRPTIPTPKQLREVFIINKVTKE